MYRTHFCGAALAGVALLAIVLSQSALAEQVGLQQPTAQLSQGGFDVGNLIDNLYPNNDAAGVGWANNAGGDNIAVFETTSDLSFDPKLPGTLRFNLFAGGFPSHTIGKYRFSYTTDDRSTFADGLANGGDVTATWIPITPSTVFSSGGATLTVQGDGSVLASGANPNLSTDSIYASFGPDAGPAGVTGFRIEAIEDPSFVSNGPGRAPQNGNFVARELDVAAFPGTRVALQNGTAQASQGGFSVDNMLNGGMPFTSAGGDGWANATGAGVGGTPSNAATFETVTTLPDANSLLTIEILSGGFGQHTLGHFRISATNADPALFADGNDNGGAGVGNEGIWTVLDPLAITSDNPSTIFTEDDQHFITATGPSAEFEHYTLSFFTTLPGITGFRLETPEISGGILPADGPGRASNGNFVIREFNVFAATVPEPSTLAIWSLLAVGLAGLGWFRARRKK